MTYDEIYKRIMDGLGTHQGGVFGTSYIDSAANYGAAKRQLKALYADKTNGITDADFKNIKRSLNGAQATQIVNGAATAIQGLTGIASTAAGLSENADIRDRIGQYAAAGNIGRRDYTDFSQIANDVNSIEASLPMASTAQQIYGKTNADKVLGVGSTTLQGITSGAAVGGLPGAIAGVVIGLGAGLFGMGQGEANAQLKADYEKNYRANAIRSAYNNVRNSHEKLLDSSYNAAYGHIAKRGGRIERRMPTAKEFAGRILSSQASNDVSHSANISRQYCKGGLRIRIKR